MFPLKDENPTRRKPILTYALIIVNVAIFVGTLATGTFEQSIKEYGMKPNEVLVGQNLHTLFTSMFLHGGILHILFNMWYLWIFGDNIEDVLGKGKFILFYLGAGLVASLVHAFSDPSSMVPTIGASGAIAGVLGAYMLLYPWARVHTAIIFFLHHSLGHGAGGRDNRSLVPAAGAVGVRAVGGRGDRGSGVLGAHGRIPSGRAFDLAGVDETQETKEIHQANSFLSSSIDGVTSCTPQIPL